MPLAVFHRGGRWGGIGGGGGGAGGGGARVGQGVGRGGGELEASRLKKGGSPHGHKRECAFRTQACPQDYGGP